MSRKSVFYVTKNFSNNSKHVLSLQPLYAIISTFSSEDQSQAGIENSPPSLHFEFFRVFFWESGMQKSKQEQEQKSPGKEGNYFESTALIRFEKIYLVFMSVCFKSFGISHNFSKTTALVRNHVVWVILKIYQSMYDSKQFVFEQIKQVNDEEQLLRIFGCLYFKIKCNNHKKRFIEFFLARTFRIIRRSC